MSKHFLSVKNIYVSKENKNILQDISFNIGPGELISVLGPSGSGKTTLINTLMGFNKIDSGEILCLDEVLANSKKNKSVESRSFSAVFQSLNLFPHLSVRENILYGISRQSSVRKNERLKELSLIVNLEDKLHRDIGTLSGGEKQRVAIARGLAPKPLILFLDEPFSSLDKNLQTDVRCFIKKVLKDSGVAAFLVTHDKEDASYFSDRVMILNEGKLVQFDTPYNIYNNPANDFVASFFGLSLKLKDSEGLDYYPCLNEIGICATPESSSLKIVSSAIVVDQYFNLGEYYCTLELEAKKKIVVRTHCLHSIGETVGLYLKSK